jgi:hypothetical protein
MAAIRVMLLYHYATGAFNAMNLADSNISKTLLFLIYLLTPKIG